MTDRLFILLGFIIGLGPTFGLLWAIMARYESKIDDRATNTSFIIGIFGGLLVIVGHLFFIVNYSISAFGLVSAFGLALAECLLYYVYLNRKKLKTRSDKSFMGLAFALGSASMYIAFIMGQMLVNHDYYWDDVLGMIIFAAGVATIRGSMGILMALGNNRSKMLKNALIGSIVLGFFNVLVLIYLNPIKPFFWIFSVPAMVYGMIVFAVFFKKLADVKRWDPKL